MLRCNTDSASEEDHLIGLISFRFGGNPPVQSLGFPLTIKWIGLALHAVLGGLVERTPWLSLKTSQVPESRPHEVVHPLPTFR